MCNKGAGVFVNILKKLHTGDVRQLKLKIFLHVIIIQLCTVSEVLFEHPLQGNLLIYDYDFSNHSSFKILHEDLENFSGLLKFNPMKKF